MGKEYLDALEIIKNIELSHVEYDQDEDFNGDWVFETIEVNDGPIEYSYPEQIDILEQALQRLETIDNAKSSEALGCLERMWYDLPQYYEKEYNTIKLYILKSQEQEKENELLKEIIKSFFDRGCPLHQYIDKDGELTIEVDDDCSIMRLGEYKGVDLDKKLKEVLENE